MAVAPLDVYSIVADPKRSADEKRAAIDMLYGAGAPPAAASDMRVASNDSVPSDSVMFGSGALNAPPAQAASDVPAGGMSMAPPAPAAAQAVSAATPAPPPAPPAPAGGMSLPPEPNMSPIPQVSEAQPAAQPAAPPAAEHGAGAPLAEPSADALTSAGVSGIVRAALRGTPARRVAEQDMPIGSVIAHAGAIPPEAKQALADDAAAQAKTALEEGEAAAKAHLDAAIGADINARDARAEREAVAAREKAGHEHVQRLDEGFEKLVKDTAVKPSDWWTTKDTGHKVLAVLSAVMFGLAGDPKGLDKIIDDDLALKQAQREKLLGARKNAIDTFRARLLSPEAAAAADRALAAQAVAAEATRLAEAAAAPEARLRAQQVAQQYQSEFDRLSAQMAKEEAGTVTTHLKHIPAGVIGGSPDLLATIKRLKDAGYNAEGIARVLAGGQYGNEASPDEAKRRVTFGAGDQVGYVGNESTQPEAQHMASALTGLRGAYNRILELTRSTGHTLAGPEKAALEANVASAMLKLQAMAKGEGANARLAGEMLERLEPLTGAAALKTGMLDANAVAQVTEARRLVDDQIESLKGELTPSPKTAPSGGKIQTLGKSKASLGFEAD